MGYDIKINLKILREMYRWKNLIQHVFCNIYNRTDYLKKYTNRWSSNFSYLLLFSEVIINSLFHSYPPVLCGICCLQPFCSRCKTLWRCLLNCLKLYFPYLIIAVISSWPVYKLAMLYTERSYDSLHRSRAPSKLSPSC